MICSEWDIDSALRILFKPIAKCSYFDIHTGRKSLLGAFVIAGLACLPSVYNFHYERQWVVNVMFLPWHCLFQRKYMDDSYFKESDLTFVCLPKEIIF
jgi:hypothetical protein